jgi:hypothetical protein
MLRQNKRRAAHFSNVVIDKLVYRLLADGHPDFAAADIRFHAMAREDGIIVAITALFDPRTQYAVSKLIPVTILRYKRLKRLYSIISDYLRLMAKEMVAYHETCTAKTLRGGQKKTLTS